MELRHLRYFLAIAEELSYRKAAARVHIAQPALSVQMRNLEAEIGAELFAREEGRGIKLTDAGTVFLEYARETLSHISAGVTRARQVARGESANLSIGFVPAAEYLVFPKIVPALRKHWPNVHLTFRDLKTLEQLEAIRREEIDLAFGWLPVPTKDFDVEKLLDETFIAVVPVDHPLASKPVVSVADLSNEPLIFFPRNIYPDTHRSVERLFLSAGSVMNVVYELENSFSMINFVALGSACSLLPSYAAGIHHEGVTFRPLKPPNLVINLAMIKKKGRGGIVESICWFTKNAVSTNASPTIPFARRGHSR
jgi:DNA-binding transcriptional LysR family regulator